MFFIFLAFATMVFGAEIRGTILPVPVPGEEVPTLFVSGDAVRRTANVHADGSFTLSDLSSNSVYLVEVYSVQHVYDTLRLDVGSTDKVVARLLNGTDEFLPQPLRLSPLTRAVYYDPEARFNPLSMLRNPMVLMMIVMLGCTTLLPKAMESMDPEALREGREMLHGSTPSTDGGDGRVQSADAASPAASASFGGNVRRLRK